MSFFPRKTVGKAVSLSLSCSLAEPGCAFISWIRTLVPGWRSAEPGGVEGCNIIVCCSITCVCARV